MQISPLLMTGDAGIEIRLIAGGSNPRSSFDHTWPPLRHMVVVFMQQGRLLCKITPGTRLAVSRKQLLIIPAGHSHAITTVEPPVHYLWVHIQATVLGAIDFSELYEFPPALNAARSRRIAPIMKRIVGGGETNTVAAMLERKALGYLLATELVASAQPRPGGLWKTVQQHRLQDVLRYIHANLGEQLSRANLAEMAHLSPSRFTAVFCEAVGASPMVYVKTVRLRRAQELLAQESLAIKEIAGRLGFFDEYHLSKQFVSAFGMRPGAYRRQVREAMSMYRG